MTINWGLGLLTTAFSRNRKLQLGIEYLRSCLSIHMLVTANTAKEELSSIKLFTKAHVQCDLRIINMEACCFERIISGRSRTWGRLTRKCQNWKTRHDVRQVLMLHTIYISGPLSLIHEQFFRISASLCPSKVSTIIYNMQPKNGT